MRESIAAPDTSPAEGSVWRVPALLAGDALAIAGTALVGLLSHGMSADLPPDLLRVGAPFLLGWLAAAALAGAYRPAPPSRFLARTALAWALGIGLGLVLRNTLFGESWSPTFAVVSYLTHGIALLGWRALYARIASG